MTVETFYHGTSAANAGRVISHGFDVDARTHSDPGDFGWGTYLTSEPARARQYGNTVLAVTVDTDNFARIRNPYFLEGLKSIKPKGAIERLFYGVAFDKKGDMLTVTGDDREAVSRKVALAFLDAGYDGIITGPWGSNSGIEVVVFDPDEAVVDVARVAKRNPPTDLLEKDCVGLISLHTVDDNLLIVAADVRFEFGEHTELMGMLLTRPAEMAEEEEERDLLVYQVTRSAIRKQAPTGLGPRLYQYALYIVSIEDPPGVLQPDEPVTLSDSAKRVWRVFHDHGWGLGADRNPYLDWYRYEGSSTTTTQLLAADERGREWIESADYDNDDMESILFKKALATFGSAIGH